MSDDFDLNLLALDDGRLIYTVSQISDEIKLVLEDSYPAVWLEGEISDFKTYNSGHMYFYLKDENAQIKAVMFQNANISLTFAPKDGMKVLVFGRISSYPKRGDYQIIVNKMEVCGRGLLSEEFEKLKKKLQALGYFDEAAKKEIPKLINKIGVITSQDGAALRDILSVLEDLEANAEVLIYPVRVQGKEAEKEIPQALHYLNANCKDIDVLLVGRGGGSIEDLWAFNTEAVAKAIFDSTIPVISCVGHETDFTIADFVADLRAPTPSAAAEIAVRGKKELKRRVETLQETLTDEMNFVVENYENRLKLFSSARAFQKPHLIYEDKITYVDELGGMLFKNIKILCDLKYSKLGDVSHKLDLISPLSVLNRGYSICKDESGNIIKNADSLKIGETINVKFSQGAAAAKVITTTKD
ncbi:MAG: exodeoxyribonuclease VII large subunit [Endomicrobium sp.]|jgi:exodeoxyribonuclease VII large subunit|nr:exodeoxyribonuclease VII large subunit [Endomicrobium sp.]